jgi:multidrug efflux pump subunit AcrB
VVWVDLAALAARAAIALDVATAIKMHNVSDPTGRITPELLAELEIAKGVRIRDVARIADQMPPPGCVAYLERGGAVVEGIVRGTADPAANHSALAAIHSALADIRTRVPPGVTLTEIGPMRVLRAAVPSDWPITGLAGVREAMGPSINNALVEYEIASHSVRIAFTAADEAAATAAISARLRQIPGIGPVGEPVATIVLRADDRNVLIDAARTIERNVGAIEKHGLDDEREVTSRVDRDAAAELGVADSDVTSTLALLVGEVVADRDVPVVLRIRDQTPSDAPDPLKSIERMYVRAKSGTIVPLSALVQIATTRGVTELLREDRQPAILLRVGALRDDEQDMLLRHPPAGVEVRVVPD